MDEQFRLQSSRLRTFLSNKTCSSLQHWEYRKAESIQHPIAGSTLWPPPGPAHKKKTYQQESVRPIYDVQTPLPVPPSHTNKLFDASGWCCNGACPPPTRYILLSRWTGHPVFDSSTHSTQVSHCRLLGINLSICSNKAHLVVQTKSHKREVFQNCRYSKGWVRMCIATAASGVHPTHKKAGNITFESSATMCSHCSTMATVSE